MSDLYVRPHLAFHMGPGYPRLDPEKTYPAIHATNQPDWEERGAIFVEGILLERGDYAVVEGKAPAHHNSPNPED